MRATTLALAALLLGTTAFAQVGEKQPAKTVNELTYPEAFGVTLLHLVSSNPERQETGKRMSDAIIITGLLTSGLQHATNSARPAPFQSDKHAFPSGHTSLAFAVAASLTEREPSAKWIAFPLAAAAGWAREDLRRHTWAQVIGGAVLGTYIGHQAGEGKLTIFGHNDSELSTAQQSADYVNPAHSVGPANQMVVWGTSF
jgi:membrane-associated phospholipid phosphatase